MSTDEHEQRRNEETLRADRAEGNLREADRKLARLLQIADAWDQQFGGKMINAGMAAETVRSTIRGHR